MATLRSLDVEVLSPLPPIEAVESLAGDFLVLAGDQGRDHRALQQRHLDAIARADLLWIATERHYLGSSVALEIGYAASAGVPIFCDQVLDSDLGLSMPSDYVTQ